MTDVETEDNTYEEPKKNDPFCTLPKSTMNLAACKDMYNRERHEGLSYFAENSAFWTQYDPIGFSIYLGQYKYNSDLSAMDFVRRNTVGGMIHDMDETLTHKHMFGVYKILRDEAGHYSVTCVFITRGQDILPEVFGPQHEYFSWEKLDTDISKKLISEAFHSVDLFQDKTVDHHVIFV